MTWENFTRLIRGIYSTFGRTYPGDGSAVVASAWLRAERVPDSLCRPIAERFADMDILPQNLGKAILHCVDAWRAEHPGHMQREDCPLCRNERFLHCWRETARGWSHVVSRCPNCSRNPDALTAAALEARGYRVMDPGFPGGPVAFDRDNGFGALWPPQTLDRAALMRNGGKPTASGQDGGQRQDASGRAPGAAGGNFTSSRTILGGLTGKTRAESIPTGASRPGVDKARSGPLSADGGVR